MKSVQEQIDELVRLVDEHARTAPGSAMAYEAQERVARARGTIRCCLAMDAAELKLAQSMNLLLHSTADALARALDALIAGTQEARASALQSCSLPLEQLLLVECNPLAPESMDALHRRIDATLCRLVAT